MPRTSAAEQRHGGGLDSSKHSSFSSRRVGGSVSQTDTDLNTTTHTRTSYGGRSISDASESGASVAAVRGMTANGRSGAPSFRVQMREKDGQAQAARPSVASTVTAQQRSERSHSTGGAVLENDVTKSQSQPPARKSSACVIL